MITLAAIFAAGVCLTLTFPLIVKLIVSGQKITGIPPCLLKELFGLNCPLCGGTRCVNALMHLSIKKAVWYNPMVIVSLAFFGIWYVRSFIKCLTEKDADITPDRRAVWVFAIMWAVFALVRNLPFYQEIFY